MSAELLESFDLPQPPSAAESAYDRGFADGHAAAAKACAENQSLLTDELIQTLKDIEFRYAEVRAELLSSIGPLFETICKKILPDNIDQFFALRIAEVLRNAAVSITPASPSITVHPTQFEALKTAILELDPAISVHADASLGSHAVIIGGPADSQLFDPHHLIAEVSSILKGLEQPQERKSTHG